MNKFLRSWRTKFLVLAYALLSLSPHAVLGAENITINNAWYGTQDDWFKNGPTRQKSGIVINKLKDTVTKYGFIVIPGNMNAFYGFDPLFGTVKTTAIDATVNGVRKIDYRAPEGQDFVYPASYRGTDAANKALAALKGLPAQSNALALTPAPAPVVAQAPASVTASTVVAPEDFEEEVGSADCVAVGSRNGDLEAWRVDADGKLYRYNKYTMAVDPWALMDANAPDGKPLAMPLEWVSVSSDGVMCVVDHNGKAHMYDWDKKVFNRMTDGPGNEALFVEFIAVGNKDSIWAVDGKKRNILLYTNSGWTIAKQGEAVFVAAGSDGSVVALNTAGEAYSYLGSGNWDDMPGTHLARVAVGNKGIIWGVGVKGELYTYVEEVASLTPVQASVSVVATTASQTSTDSTARTRTNKWKKKGKKRSAKGAADKKGKGKAGRKNVQATDVTDVTTARSSTQGTNVPAAPVQTQSTQSLAGKWVQVKGKSGVLATGFSEVAVNAVGTVFAIDIKHNVYHKGNAGMVVPAKNAITSGAAAESAMIAPSDPGKKTRDQAKKEGTLDVSGDKEKARKGKKDSSKRHKSRVVKTKKMKKPAKKGAKAAAKAS